MGLARRWRLADGRRIRAVGEFGARASGPLGTVLLLASEGPESRLALVISRRVGCAVERNRARRRLQESFRRLQPRLAGACDIVFRARRAGVEADFERLDAGLTRLLTALGALE
jgi:ribonuclease P protein component